MPAYEPRQFLDLLSTDSLVEPAVLTVYGPVKADPDDAQSLLFAFSRPCDRWLRVPLPLIASVNYARNVTCGDHEHPFVYSLSGVRSRTMLKRWSSRSCTRRPEVPVPR